MNLKQTKMDITAEIKNYNMVKDIVLHKLVSEGLLDESDASEFSDRCQVLVYKGSWWTKWFNKHIKINNPDANENNYHMRIIELNEKEDYLKKLIKNDTDE
jgi:hypothetical protein